MVVVGNFDIPKTTGLHVFSEMVHTGYIEGIDGRKHENWINIIVGAGRGRAQIDLQRRLMDRGAPRAAEGDQPGQ